MRKKINLLACMFMLLMVFALCTVSVGAKEYVSVFDAYDLLSDAEERELNAELSEIYDTYGFDAVLLISEDVHMNERTYAAEFMQENAIGFGDEMDGMCIFHQPDCRNIAIVFRGQYQDDFSVEIQDIMLDHCTEKLKENNTMDAYRILIADLKNGLERAVNGKSVRPMDIDGDGILGYGLMWLLLSFLIMAIPVLILTLVQIAKMKTKTAQENADFYAPRESFTLGMCRDVYLRTDVKKIKIEKDNHHSGSSGSFGSKGESFSGSSRNY